MKIAFITWMPHCRRSDAIAEALGGRSYLVHYLKFKRPLWAPIKYVVQTIKTFRILFQERPDLVLVASPPMIAVLPVWLFSSVNRIPFVIDAHTGVFDNPRWRRFAPLNRYLSRRAALTIVTNEYLRDRVRRWGARTMVIGDLPIDFTSSGVIHLTDGFHVVVVNSFSEDEPLAEILEAAKNSRTIRLHITGDVARASPALLQRAPSNVRFTGWLADEIYIALLRAAGAVMVLTKRNHTMQRGAYEAMSLGKPLITSDWPLLRETFHSGTVHVSNTAKDIESALAYVSKESARLSSEMRALKAERQMAFRLKRDEFWEALAPWLPKNQGGRETEILES